MQICNIKQLPCVKIQRDIVVIDSSLDDVIILICTTVICFIEFNNCCNWEEEQPQVHLNYSNMIKSKDKNCTCVCVYSKMLQLMVILISYPKKKAS